ncbi:response regulator [Aquabacterium sp.]|uniref:response regulator n=1 Tax=Aquabacterium sp. TaxID=1872578 RepID=UPI00378457F6
MNVTEPERRTLSVLIVDDHAIVREGIRRILESNGESWAIHEAKTGFEALDLLRRHPIDVALVDLSMPGMSGIELTRRIKTDLPRTGVLMLSMHAEDAYAIRAFKNGASGYLTKDSAAAELLTAVRRVAAGRTYVTADQAEHVVQQLNRGTPGEAHDQLSDRELDVLRRIVAGQRLKEIAEDLSLSIKTVSTHKTRIQEKRQLGSTAALIRYGMEEGLTSDPRPSGPMPLE